MGSYVYYIAVSVFDVEYTCPMTSSQCAPMPLDGGGRRRHAHARNAVRFGQLMPLPTPPPRGTVEAMGALVAVSASAAEGFHTLQDKEEAVEVPAWWEWERTRRVRQKRGGK